MNVHSYLQYNITPNITYKKDRFIKRYLYINTSINIDMHSKRGSHMNDSTKEKILKLLKEEKVITSSELAKFLDVSWNTAQAYLMDLALDGLILRVKKEGVNLWLMK